MKISEETLEAIAIDYPLEALGNPEKLLFVDIETTGFTARSSYLYLIGCAYYSNGYFRTIQYLAESYEQEIDILKAFFEFAKDYDTLIHYNGNNFDLPYLLQKCQQYELPYDFEDKNGIDLYKRISPLRHILKLPSCKQKAVEAFMEVDRKDAFSGGELIGIYHDYVKNPSEFSRNSLLLHNEDDLKGMLQILPMLAYYDMFNEELRVKKAAANTYNDYQGQDRSELVLELELNRSIPKGINASANGCYIKAEGSSCNIKVPIYTEEMKYFYSNYKDYYYLPEEDLALHKSVATFVDKDQRTSATAATCYTRKQSSYLPQWDIILEPIFRRDYRSKEIFFEITDELKRDRRAFTQYANHILSMIASSY